MASIPSTHPVQYSAGTTNIASQTGGTLTITPGANTGAFYTGIGYNTGYQTTAIGYNSIYSGIHASYDIDPTTESGISREYTSNQEGKLPVGVFNRGNATYAEAKFSYASRGDSYKVFIENELDGLSPKISMLSKAVLLGRRCLVLAIDKNLGRLEMCAVIPSSDAVSNVCNILDSGFFINLNDRGRLLRELYSRDLPCICRIPKSGNYNKSLHYDNDCVQLDQDTKAGIIPIMHLSNVLLGYSEHLIGPMKATPEYIRDNATVEVDVYVKHHFPNVQPYFSPEYAYLTLDTAKDISKLSRISVEYTKEGIISLLQDVCVDGTDVTTFVEFLVGNIGLDQYIKDPEASAMNTVKQLLGDF